MKENHTQMYQAFVQKLVLPKNNHSNENDVSREYRTHFINKFGVTEDNFKEAVVALSARELLGQILASGSVLAMTAFSFLNQSVRSHISDMQKMTRFMSCLIRK